MKRICKGRNGSAAKKGEGCERLSLRGVESAEEGCSLVE